MSTAASHLAPGVLARFQDDFAQALMVRGEISDTQIATLAAQPAFAVYRNTVMKGCIDALQANFPAVARLVGEEWFRAAAAVYVRELPPADPALLHYGEQFNQFLARFEPAAELPYLPGVARLDRYWTEAHIAADEDVLDPSMVSHLSPDELARTVLHPHAAARWAWFADAPIYTIWSRNRAEHLIEDEFDWHAEGALLTRSRDAVQWCAIDAAACAFLDACAAGKTLPNAAQAAFDVQGTTDLARLMTQLLEAGAFSHMSIA